MKRCTAHVNGQAVTECALPFTGSEHFVQVRIVNSSKHRLTVLIQTDRNRGAAIIVNKIGSGNARYLLVSGSQFDGESALRYGLAQILVPSDKLESTTRKTAEQMAALGPVSVTKTKELLNYLDRKAFDISKETKDYCASLISTARKSDESQERVSSFFNKNKSNND